MDKINIKRMLIVITVIFLALNISWFLITIIKYSKFVESISKDGSGVYAMKNEDGYIYNVKKPAYLHYTGNLGVSNYNKGEFLIIWPLMFDGYKYGFRIKEVDAVYEVYVDENMKPIDKEDKYIAKKVEEHKAGLETLFLKANEMWQLEE